METHTQPVLYSNLRINIYLLFVGQHLSSVPVSHDHISSYLDDDGPAPNQRVRSLREDLPCCGGYYGRAKRVHVLVVRA